MTGGNSKSKGANKDVSEGIKDAKAHIAGLKGLPPQQQYEAMVAKLEAHLEKLQNIENGVESADTMNSKLEGDLSRATNTIAKLEGLCKELEKMRKAAREENLSRIKAEENKRREVSNKLNSSMANISGLMQVNTERNLKLRNENAVMANTLTDLGKEYEEKQEVLSAAFKQLELQAEMIETKHNKMTLDATQGQKKYLTEKEKLLTQMKEYQEKIAKQDAEELKLRENLGKFGEQYSVFQETIESNNGLMTMFRTQMSTMSTQIRQLEKESALWQAKWKKCNKSIVEMVQDRTTLVASCSLVVKQNAKLQQLGKTLLQRLTQEEGGSAPLDAKQLAILDAAIDTDFDNYVKVSDSLFTAPDSKEPTPEPLQKKDTVTDSKVLSEETNEIPPVLDDKTLESNKQAQELKEKSVDVIKAVSALTTELSKSTEEAKDFVKNSKPESDKIESIKEQEDLKDSTKTSEDASEDSSAKKPSEEVKCNGKTSDIDTDTKTNASSEESNPEKKTIQATETVDASAPEKQSENLITEL